MLWVKKLTLNLNDNSSTWIDFDHAEQRFNDSDARLGELSNSTVPQVYHQDWFI